MSFPESNKFSHAKRPKSVTMNSSESLYLDSEVAREQRRQAEAEVEANQVSHISQSPSTASGSSISEFGQSVSTIAQESAETVKQTVVEGVPNALHAVQEQISALAGGAKEVEETVSDSLSEESQADREHIDNMPNERVCDFLRQKHMSNTHPRPTN